MSSGQQACDMFIGATSARRKLLLRLRARRYAGGVPNYANMSDV